MCSSVSAAAVAVSCDEAICSMSCVWVCCADCPGGKISASGTTALVGLSQPRSAWKMFSRTPGPPLKPTVTMLRCPVVGYVWCPLILISGCPDGSLPSVFSVGPGSRIT